MDKITREWSDNSDDDLSRIDRDVSALFEAVNTLIQEYWDLKNLMDKING